MDMRSVDHLGRPAAGRLVAPLILCSALLSGGPALAQSGAFQSVFGGGVPAATPSRQTEPDRNVLPDSTVVRKAPPGLRLPPGGVSSTRPDLSDEELAVRDRQYSPPAGFPIRFARPPNPRLNRHLGESVVEASVAGTRLGGGYNSPSPEAVTYDSADLLDYRVQALSSTTQP